ncbi:hypothetical protein GOODEAATRI_031729, partial [Goodea atripinnis]
LRCAVCINGSHVQPMDGFLNEMLNYFTEHWRNIHFTKDNEAVWRDILLPIPTDLSHKVDVSN